MASTPPAIASRRAAVAGLAGFIAGSTLPVSTTQAAPRPAIKFTGGGVAGGGLVKWNDGEAQLSLFLTRFNPESGFPIFVGRVQWVDTGKSLLFETLEIQDYGPVAGQPNARAAIGRLTVNGSGNHPFRIQVVDAGQPGSGLDTISFEVGAEGDSLRYSASGNLAVGDFELLTFNFEL